MNEYFKIKTMLIYKCGAEENFKKNAIAWSIGFESGKLDINILFSSSVQSIRSSHKRAPTWKNESLG